MRFSIDEFYILKNVVAKKRRKWEIYMKWSEEL